MAAIRGVHRLETNQWILLVGAGFGPDSLQASQNSHGWGPSCPGNPRGKFLFHQVGFQKKPFTQSCCKQIDWLNTMDHFTNVSLTSRYVIRGLISHTELIYIYNWKSKIRISIMYICVLFLATAPIYTTPVYRKTNLHSKHVPSECLKLVWNSSETSSEASIVPTGERKANHTKDCLLEMNSLFHHRPLYSGGIGMCIRYYWHHN